MRTSVPTIICDNIMKSKAQPTALFSKFASNSHISHHVVSCGGRLRNGALGVHNAYHLHFLYIHWTCQGPDDLLGDLEEGSGPAMEPKRLPHDGMHVPSSCENKYDSCCLGVGDQQ